MGHQGVQASCFKYIHFAYNYVYPTHTYPRCVYPRYIYPRYTYLIYTYSDYIYIHIFLYTHGIYAKKKSYLEYTYPIHVY
jgi:hypothetical protein